MKQSSCSLSWKLITSICATAQIIFAGLTNKENRTISLSVNKHVGPCPPIVSEGQRLQIVCKWENASTVSILDTSNTALENCSTSNDTIECSEFVRNCSTETMTFRCEGEGSNYSDNITLLVKCPPTLSNVSHMTSNGDTVSLNFSMQTHIPHATDCRLTKYSETLDSIDGGYQCNVHNQALGTNCSSSISANYISTAVVDDSTRKCDCTISGLVPDLNLELSLMNVTSSDSGHWRVNVTNNGGSSAKDFYVSLPKIPAGVKKLTVNGQDSNRITVEKSENLHLECSWENVNPPSRIYLLYNNVVLTSDNRTYGIMRHTVSTAVIGCNECAVIWCQTQESESNKSVKVIVKCPLGFESTGNRNYTASVHKSVDISFKFLTPMRDISYCYLRLYPLSCTTTEGSCNTQIFATYHCLIEIRPPDFAVSGSSTACRERKCMCSITDGLNLTVSIIDVTVKDVGNWHVILDSLSGDDFFLQLSEAQDVSGLHFAFMVVAVVFITFGIGLILAFIDCALRSTNNTRYVLLHSDESRPAPEPVCEPKREENTTGDRTEETVSESVPYSELQLSDSTPVPAPLESLPEEPPLKDEAATEPSVQIYRQGQDMKIVLFVKGKQLSYDDTDLSTDLKPEYLTPCLRRSRTMECINSTKWFDVDGVHEGDEVPLIPLTSRTFGPSTTKELSRRYLEQQKKATTSADSRVQGNALRYCTLPKPRCRRKLQEFKVPVTEQNRERPMPEPSFKGKAESEASIESESPYVTIDF